MHHRYLNFDLLDIKVLLTLDMNHKAFVGRRVILFLQALTPLSILLLIIRLMKDMMRTFLLYKDRRIAIVLHHQKEVCSYFLSSCKVILVGSRNILKLSWQFRNSITTKKSQLLVGPV